MTEKTTHKVNYINDTQDGLNIYIDNSTLYSCVNTSLVCRLGFNPTETIEIAEKRVA